MVSQPEPLTLKQQRLGMTLQTESQTRRSSDALVEQKTEVSQGQKVVLATRASAQIPASRQRRRASSVSQEKQTLRRQRLGSSVQPEFQTHR